MAQGHRVLAAAKCTPRADHVPCIVGQWSNQCDRRNFCSEWQNRRSGNGFVAQQNQGTRACILGESDALRTQHSRRFFAFICVRVIEKSHCVFNAEDAANRLVNFRLRHLSGLHELHHIAVIEVADHVHIDAGKKRFAGSGRAVNGDTVRHHLCDGIPIAYNKTPEAPFLPQNLLQGKWIRRRWNSVQRIECAHERAGSGFFRCMKGWQIKLTQSVF